MTDQTFNRYEFKYPMPDRIAQGIHALLLRYGMEPDPSAIHKQDHAYTVTSVYFDSPVLGDYNDKAGGFLSRKKIRVRIYTPTLTEDTPEIWLEKKAKHDMRVRKSRILLPFEGYRTLLNGSRTSFLQHYGKSPHGHEIIHHLIRDQMKPHIIVRYQRAPLVGYGPADFRVTFDSNMETCFSRDLCYTPAMKNVYPGSTIMEVKFSSILPFWFKDMLRRYNLERASFSKYTNALETLRTYNPIPR